jgi:imidazoleglycerol phosphate synthase glutamine amidotransferase subunit HisH
MIYIIGYDKTGAKEAYDLFSKFNVEIKIGKNEVDALNSDKIVLPDTKHPVKALRKLHLYNLYSALRIYKKPILGMGNGFALMCVHFNNRDALGFFKCNTIADENEIKIVNIDNNLLFDKKLIADGNYAGVISNISSPEAENFIKDFVES